MGGLRQHQKRQKTPQPLRFAFKSAFAGSSPKKQLSLNKNDFLRNSHGKSQNSKPGEKPGNNLSPNSFLRWEQAKLTYKIGDYADTSIIDYAHMLRNWTKIWFGMPASELTRGDGREVLRLCQEAGKPLVFVRRLKNTINLVYTWAIEEKFVTGVHTSPLYGIDIGKEKEERLPEILTRDETQRLITQADERRHPWACVWKGALLTGMRSGELHALPWSKVEMIHQDHARFQDALSPVERRYGMIRVHRTWNTRTRSFGPTKGGYWRTIPISKELYWFLVELRIATGKTEYVFPRSWEWDKGLGQLLPRSRLIARW